MIYSQRSKRKALFSGDNGETFFLERLPFMTATYNEEWLQHLIEEHPDLLPSSSFGADFGEIVSIRKEVPVGSEETKGFIDNLFISPTGRLVIVETKLFRNQESRRNVLAQIIDYAEEIQTWDSEKLDAAVSDYFLKREGQASRIIDVLCREGKLSYSDESELTDNINECLKNAQFLLLIVGDGIRTGLQQIADFLNSSSFRQLQIGLVELEIYKVKSGLLVIPNLLTMTSVVEKHYYSPTARLVDRNGNLQRYVKKPILSRREFISRFAECGGYDADEVTEFISDLDIISGLFFEIAPTEMSLKFKVKDRVSPILTFSISGDRADLYILPDKIRNTLEAAGLFSFEAEDFLDFYRSFVDTKRCKAPPYEYGKGRFYYAKISDVLLHKSSFIEELEKFALRISD